MRGLRKHSPDQNYWSRFGGLPHQQRGCRRKLVSVTDDGDPQGTSMQVSLTAQVESRCNSGATDYHTHGTQAPGPSETVIDDHARLTACQLAKARTQPGGTGIGIFGQEQRELAARGIGQVGLIDPCVGHDQSQTVLDNQNVLDRPDDAARLTQYQLDEPR